jgi:RND family efflux transporter MFP subunit
MLLLALCLAACQKQEANEERTVAPSVAVTTQVVHQGDLPQLVEAHGTVVPEEGGVLAMSLQVQGMVSRLDVTVGEAVRHGQVLLVFEPTASAAAAFQQAQTAMRAASAQRDHVAQLLERQLATREQLTEAQKSLDDARSALEALRRQHGSGAPITLLAPQDGIVTAIAAKSGEVLQQGAPLLDLAGRDGLVVRVGVVADDQKKLAAGDRATLLPLDGGATTGGVVRHMAAMLEEHTHLLTVDIAPDGPVLLGAGYRADIVTGHWHGWLVPREALVREGDAWHVFPGATGKAAGVAVTLLGANEGTAVVAGALDGSRPLVVAGSAQLEDGMAARPADQAASAP